MCSWTFSFDNHVASLKNYSEAAEALRWLVSLPAPATAQLETQTRDLPDGTSRLEALPPATLPRFALA